MKTNNRQIIILLVYALREDFVNFGDSKNLKLDKDAGYAFKG